MMYSFMKRKWFAFDSNFHFKLFNPAAAGPPRHPPAAGGHKVARPLYFCDDIVATRRDREHRPEYLAEVVSKFGVDPI